MNMTKTEFFALTTANNFRSRPAEVLRAIADAMDEQRIGIVEAHTEQTFSKDGDRFKLSLSVVAGDTRWSLAL